MSKVRLGLVGCGGMSKSHMRRFHTLGSRLDLVAAVDVVEERAAAAAELVGGARVATDYREILDDVEQFASDEAFFNYKSALLEWTQGEGKGHPVYSVKSEQGPDHKKTFVVEVTVQGQRFGKGMGKNKKSAEQMAAKETLNLLDVGI